MVETFSWFGDFDLWFDNFVLFELFESKQIIHQSKWKRESIDNSQLEKEKEEVDEAW